TKIMGSNEKIIMGVKKDELSQIIDIVFKLENGQISNPYLRSFNADEILYYYCYVSRMVESKVHYSTEEINEIQQEVSEIMKKQKEKIKAEDEDKKEKIRKAEEEKRLKEEIEKRAEQERLANMSEFEIKLENIKNNDIEANYVE